MNQAALTIGSGAVRQGYSENPDPREAVTELAAQVMQPSMSLVAFFCSPAYDLEQIDEEIRAQFPAVQVIGCTTAGEITQDGYKENSISGFSLGAPDFKAHHALITDLAHFEIEQGSARVLEILHRLNPCNAANSLLARSTFGMLLIDGMSKQEELVVSALNGAIDPIPLFGGSAGDGLKFSSTKVYCDGAFHDNAAVFTLVQTSFAFNVFKFEHFHPTGKKMVVTEADPNRRLVMEINAENAAQEYARLVGLEEHQLGPEIFAAYPVMVRVGGEYHVRSIQQVEGDGSLRFYCAIDEGLVLTLGEGQEASRSLDTALGLLKSRLGPVQLILVFDCILQRIEAEQKQTVRAISKTFRKHKVVGFSTYGEQYRSMHVNQTFTGVAIGTERISQEGR